MNINFTFTNGKLKPSSKTSVLRVKEQKTTNLKFPIKRLKTQPSSLSISLILGYAAALENIKLNEHLEFNIISN